MNRYYTRCQLERSYIYIAYLDVLGFKKLFEERSLDDITKMYCKLIETSKPSHFSINGTDIDLNFVVFSDSIIIWMKPEKQNVNYFIYHLSSLIWTSVLAQLPLRFGIAYGECVMDKKAQIFVGQPIIDAYRTESNQKWIGGAFHKSCHSAPCFDKMKDPGFAFPYNVPVKKAKHKLSFAVNWYRNHVYWDVSPEKLEELRSALDKSTDKTNTCKDKGKWRKTRHFIDFLSSHPGLPITHGGEDRKLTTASNRTGSSKEIGH